jgi:hypothetical protein
MKTIFNLTILLIFPSIFCFAQKRVMDIGLEFQAYPTGLIPGIRFEKSFTKRDLYIARLGFQLIDHGSSGEHDNEKGYGWGGTVGYKHYFGKFFRGVNLGIKTDVWRNSIDWESRTDGRIVKGNTSIRVVQPTIELGWAFLLGEDLVVTPNAAFGFEINVRTIGEPTGEGPVMLAGLTAVYRFQ